MTERERELCRSSYAAQLDSLGYGPDGTPKDKKTAWPEWISVKDRLPCDGLFVLVCNDDGHMMIAKYESEMVRWEYKYTNYDHDVWDDDEQGPVCWWMPLPEPPKEAQE